ncbi:MAG: permease [bacterium]
MMNSAVIIMAGITLVLAIAGYLKGGGLHLLGLKAGTKMFWGVLPLLIFAFAIAGLVQVLIPTELIRRWLGEETGFKGIMFGCIAGGLTPGGPYVSFPIVVSLYQGGAGIGTVVAYVTAWSLWAVSRLPMEFSLIGPKVTIIRLVSTFIFPPIAGLIAHTFFSAR